MDPITILGLGIIGLGMVAGVAACVRDWRLTRRK